MELALKSSDAKQRLNNPQDVIKCLISLIVVFFFPELLDCFDLENQLSPCLPYLLLQDLCDSLSPVLSLSFSFYLSSSLSTPSLSLSLSPCLSLYLSISSFYLFTSVYFPQFIVSVLNVFVLRIFTVIENITFSLF